MFEKNFFQSVNYRFVNFGEDKEELLSIFSSQIQYDLVSTAQGIMKFQNEQFSKYFRLSPNNSTLSFQTAITFSLAPNFGKLRRPCEEYWKGERGGERGTVQIHSYKDKYTITKKFTQIQRGDVRKGATLWECLACAVMRMEEVGGSDGQYSGGLLGGPGGFDEHVKRLRGTMFYVCKVGWRWVWRNTEPTISGIMSMWYCQQQRQGNNQYVKRTFSIVLRSTFQSAEVTMIMCFRWSIVTAILFHVMTSSLRGRRSQGAGAGQTPWWSWWSCCSWCSWWTWW